MKNPEGKVIHELEISPIADIEWSQDFRWNEEDAKNSFGTWSIIVTAKEASGNYNVSVRAN